MFPSILVVDDEASIRQSLGGILTDEGFEVMTASNGYEALRVIDEQSPDLVLLDIWMPGLDGIETLKEIKKTSHFIQVVIITGHGTIETAVQATKLGAFDFIEKPLNIDKVIVAINNALNFRRLEEENRYLRKKALEKHSLDGASAPIQALKQQIAIAAPTGACILITGENGTGKELVARTIHHLSPRAEQPMITINCAAIADTAIESELFGHEKGAFKDAISKNRGKFELAYKGTLFLDEIGDMSLKTQGKILRVLESGKFHRAGGSRTLTADVRVIAASNKDLENEIEAGRFRKELYYRLNVVPVQVPPLRQRAVDIPVLVDIFLKENSRQGGNPPKQIDPAAMEMLCLYDWPGNVRELKNLIDRLCIMIDRDTIGAMDIPFSCRMGKRLAHETDPAAWLEIGRMNDAMALFEQAYIRHHLARHHFDATATAAAIGIAVNTMTEKLKE